MLIFFIEGCLGRFKCRSNISSNKYDIIILLDTLIICLIPSFKGKNDRCSFIGVMARSRNTENTRTFVRNSLLDCRRWQSQLYIVEIVFALSRFLVSMQRILIQRWGFQCISLKNVY